MGSLQPARVIRTRIRAAGVARLAPAGKHAMPPRTRPRATVIVVSAVGAVAAAILGCASTEHSTKEGERTAQRRAVPAIDTAFIEQYAATNRFSLGTPRSARPLPGGKGVLFLRSGPRSFVQDLWLFDTATGQERLVLSADEILAGGQEVLTSEEAARRERMRMTSRGIASYSVTDDGSRVLVPLSGRLFVVDTATWKPRELKSDAGFPIDPRFSPDGKKVACARGGDLYVIDIETGAETRLTTGATESITNGLAEFVAQEEMDRREGYWWSPDSSMIAYQQTDTGGLETFHIADPMDPSKEPQAWPYPRAGKANAKVRLGVIRADGGSTVWAKWNTDSFPYLARVAWAKRSPLLMVVQNREQTEELGLEVDPLSGMTSTLFRDLDPAWLNLFDHVPQFEVLPPGRTSTDGDEILWIVETTGEASLVRFWNKRPGFLDRITPTGFGLRALIGVDTERREAFVAASSDPRQRHVWRVPIDPDKEGPPDALTSAPGVHDAVFAKDFSTAVISSNLKSGERMWRIIDRDGKELGRLRSDAEEPPFEPNVEWTEVQANDVKMYAAVIRPRSFERGRKYPVIASVYAGPGSQTVTFNRNGYLLNQWFADLGFIVVSIDGRGTPGRGRDWERIIKGDLIGIALRDQVAGLRALGAKHPEMDLDRAGVYGWSFGGYFSAMAAMRRPEVYKAAVAGAPVCDWLDYDTHYTERYMGLPDVNAAKYRDASVLTYCKDLSVPLLVIHGTSDDNVYFMHSLKMTDALFKAGKHFEFLALPGLTHMVPDPVVMRSLYSRIAQFFLMNLDAN